MNKIDPKNQTLFISKKIEDPLFIEFCKRKNWNLIDKAMIRFRDLNFLSPLPENYDIIFFSSKRSVDFFLAKITPEKRHIIACIGESTAKALEKWDLKPSFVGKKSGHPETVAKQFKTFVEERKVLFPQSNISNQSMQKQLVKDQVVNLIVYETFLLPSKLDINPAILVFTSPSNVNAFLQMNKIDTQHQKIIAWGTTTADYLTQSNILPSAVLKKSSFEELVEVLNEI